MDWQGWISAEILEEGRNIMQGVWLDHRGIIYFQFLNESNT